MACDEAAFTLISNGTYHRRGDRGNAGRRSHMLGHRYLSRRLRSRPWQGVEHPIIEMFTGNETSAEFVVTWDDDRVDEQRSTMAGNISNPKVEV